MDFSGWIDLYNLLNFSNVLWNMAMELIGVISSTTPQNFSNVAWSYTVNVIVGWTLTLGSSLFSAFYLINMLRQTTNLRQGITSERFIEIGITVIMGNYAMIYGVELMSLIFDITGTISGAFMMGNTMWFVSSNIDIGSTLFFLIFGLLYFGVTVVGVFTILFVVYSRYLNLYLLVGVGPMAWSTIPGGHGIASTASAWLKSFLAKSFEIVIIVFAINIASKMCAAINLGQLQGAGALFDGAIQMLHNMLTMIILTGAVKGADMFMHRTFGL